MSDLSKDLYFYVKSIILLVIYCDLKDGINVKFSFT